MGIRSQYFLHGMVDFQWDSVLFPHQTTGNSRVDELVSPFASPFHVNSRPGEY